MIDPDEEIRIIIHARVTDIPGELGRRYLTLIELFAKKLMDRPFQRQITPDGYDGSTIPPDFDSDQPIKRWFIYDLNVKGPKTREELVATTHKVYLACKRDEDW